MHCISAWVDFGCVLGNNIQETDQISFQSDQKMFSDRFWVCNINDETSKVSSTEGRITDVYKVTANLEK